MSMKLRVTTLVAGLMLATGALHAQPAPDYGNAPDNSYVDSNNVANAADPPSRVARLSVLQGAVSFVPAGENDWVQAQVNRPLISGDKLWTDRGARAELQIGQAAIRVDQQSSFNFLNLDDRTAQIELTQGTLNLRVRRLYEGQNYEIDTPTLAFVVNRVGEYRIDVAPDGRGTIVTALRGGGDAYGEGGARFRVEEGQSIRFNDSQLRDYVSNGVPSADDFDRFCFARDGRWENSPSRQYVSEDVIGYEDLDNNGSWNEEPEYGNVWYPTSVEAGWTPYSYGHWGWVGAYGWTWVDSSPWGFAPFHYGRWAYIHNRWGWCPGERRERAYYAPALVAFIGGGGIRVGFSSGPVGWFPLGPRDVYVPGYRVSRDYFTRVNINNTTINNVTINNFYGNYSRGNFDYSRVNYANRNIANAVTAVPGEVFVGARSIRGSALPVNRDTFASARVSGFAQIAPTRQSLAFEGGRRAQAVPPAAVLNRNIIAATRPPAPVASFEQRAPLLQRDPGRALPVSQLRVAPGTQVSGRTDVRGEGVRMQRGMAERPNVNVVTQTGVPARTPAPTIGRDVQSQTQQGAQDRARTLRGNADQQQTQQSAQQGVQERGRALDNGPRDNGPRNPRFNPNAVTPGQPSAQPSERETRAGQVDRQSQQPELRRAPRNEVQEYRSAPVERAPQPDQRDQQQRQFQQQREQQQQQQQREVQQQQQVQQREQQQRVYQQQREQQQQQQVQQREQVQTQQREQQQRVYQQQREQQQQQQVQQREQVQTQQREQQQRVYQQQREQQQQQQVQQREQQQRTFQEQQQRQVQQQQVQQQREQQVQQRQQQQPQQRQQQQQSQQPQQQSGEQQQGRRSRDKDKDKDKQDDRGHR